MALATNKKAAPQSVALVSMSPDAFTLGLFDDQDGTITDAAACVFDWNGNAPADTPALALEITDVNGGTHQQYWSLGLGSDWAPAESGEGFIALSGKTSINRSTNLGMLLESLVENGFPTAELASGNLKCLIGTNAHWLMKKTDRQGLVRGNDAKKPQGTLIVSKIHSLPGADTKKAAGTTATKANGAVSGTKAAGGKPNGAATPAPAVDTTDIDTVLTEKLMEALAETDPLPRKNLLQLASGAFKGMPNHSKAIARANAADFLTRFKPGDGNETGINFDGAQFSLA